MLPIVTALTDFLANWLYRGQCPPRGREFFIGSALHGIKSSGFVFKRTSHGPRLVAPLLRPLLTSHCISSMGSPQVRTRCFPAQPPHLPPTTEPMDFAVLCQLFPVVSAFYAVLVHRLAGFP